MTRPSRSAVVLGAGLMGRLLAVELARAGYAVQVHEATDADGHGAAARVAAAMLAPLAESAVADLSVVGMGLHSLQRWPALIAALALPVYFQQNGTLIVWHRQDSADAHLFARQIKAASDARPDLPTAQRLDAAGIARVEPNLGDHFADGLYLPNEGQLDNRQLLAALLHEMERLGVALHWRSPRELADFRPGAPGQPDWVLDCRGLGARGEWPGTRAASALRGVRGEVIRLHAPEVTLTRPTRLIHPRYPLYIAPKQDHVFVIGATEIETDDLSPASVRSTLELLSAAYTVHRGFAEARIIELATQCRPTLPDNRPALRLPRPGVLQINGLYRHGFLIAPAVLDAAMQCITTGDTTLARQLQLDVQRADTGLPA